MDSLTVLNDLRIASPCPASWDAMRGDDRVRFCDSCSKHVYNVSGLTADAAVALIRESEGHLCMRLYRRKDGTVLTADCPVGVKSAVRRRLIRLATIGVVLCAILRSGIWLFAGPSPRVAIPPPPTGPGVTFTDWADWAAAAMGFSKPSIQQVTAGKICPLPPASYESPDGGEVEGEDPSGS
jgi:hypothetical protein